VRAAQLIEEENPMTQLFKTKLLAALFVPALVLAAGAANATGTDKMKTTPSAADTTTTATPPATSTGSMKSGTSSSDATFERLDANHDGKLSSAEVASDAKVHGMWKKLDANNDGSISKSEFEAHASDMK
jgi:hypothetical protein